MGDVPARLLLRAGRSLRVRRGEINPPRKVAPPAVYGTPRHGAKAAQAIVEARKYGHFISIEDLAARTHVPAPAIDVLRAHGCLDGMTESNQVELFA